MKHRNVASHEVLRNTDKGAVTNASDTRARALVVDAILRRISAGEAVRDIFRTPGEGFPAESTWWRWLAEDDELDRRYGAAKAKGIERYADESISIADEVHAPVFDGDGNPVYRTDEHGEKHAVTCVTNEAVAHAKLRIETRKWFLSKLVPKKYGDRTVIAGDADNPIAIDDPKAILARRLAAAAAGAGSTGSDRGTD